MENFIPEQAFNSDFDVNKSGGVSATKVIDFASKNGQKIYDINLENSNVLSLLNHDVNTLNDIRNAVYGGKTVYVHESFVNYNGWKGTGYIVVDKNTGASAYMISGGLNGGDTPLSISSEILVWVGGILAGVDIGTKSFNPEKPLFNDLKIKDYKLNNLANNLGYLALAVGLWDSWDSGANICYNAIGVMTNLLSFFVSMFIVSLFMGPFGILLGLMLTSYLSREINKLGAQKQKQYC